MRKFSVAMLGEDIEPPWADGVVNTVKNWSEGLAKRGVDVEVLSTTSKEISTTCLDGVSYRYVCFKRRFRYSPDLRFQKNFIKSDRLRCYDIIHFHGFYGLTSLPLLLNVKLRRKKRILSFHNIIMNNFTLGIKNLMFNFFTVPSHRMIPKLIRQGIPKSKIVVIPPSVDESLFCPMDKAKARHILGFPTSSFIVLHAGHFKKGRGILDLVSIKRELIKEGFDDIVLVLAWTGHGEADTISTLINLSKKDKRIIILGPANNMPLIYNAADVFVLPAYSERWVIEIPLSLVEALSCGVPAIASNVGSTSELIIDGVNGFLFKPNDYTALKESLMEFLNGRINVSNLRRNARKTIVDRFSNQNVASKLLDLYEKLL